ncbi:hypothetical protein OHC33_000666 [Knufia fluminis]|uniref:Serine hydrolase domain-containing protein n=1 Tax=Knufia fluminis TaxID=191047 RepID=A0AAN8ETV5_9EURO|nr:hypothetical protein OHC33_000666 [Knufia fluminis]
MSTLAPPTQPSRTQTPDPTSTLSLPRILCLHGGGVNATIFRAQMRAFLTHPQLSTRFRFVFVEAPFFCDEGVGVHPVYSDWGPFRRWSRWLPSHPEIDAQACMHEVLYAIESGMRGDEGSGEWVGVLGFSQGAKVGCSLLLKQQLDEAAGTIDTESPLVRFKFGVILAGRAPLLALNEEMEGLKFLQSAAGLPDGADMDAIYESPEYKLRLPTVHVHGLRDEGLELHRKCVEDYCAAGTTVVVEWDGPHRIPIKRVDVERVVEAVIGMADEYGV